jgi:23S rRNA (cytosine1962-C5)-methyltransferase
VTPAARLTGKGLGRFRTGHPWIYQDDVAAVDAQDGDLVLVQDPGGQTLGHAFHSARSKISLRVCGWGEGDLPALDAWFAQRIATAIGRRSALSAAGNACRLVASEADLLPGLIVDRYAGVVVLQALTAGMERNLTHIVPALVEQLDPVMVLARHDAHVRELEGLPREVRMLHGKRVDEVEFEEWGLRFRIKPWTGHKTGFYLDQRNARRRVRELVPKGGRMLDLCCYLGGFALNALAAGAAEAVAVDASAEALAEAGLGAARNALAGLTTRAGNVFDVTRALVEDRQEFDLVVLDPPAFAKSRREVEGGVRGYLDLNRRAFELLKPGGILVSCSCSYHVTEPLFVDILREASARTGRRALLRERIPAGIDHPVFLTLPESDYLKVMVVEVVE